MNKAVLVAAALLLAPLPALCQEAPPSKDSESSYATRHGEQEDLLARLSKSELKDRIASAVEKVQEACAEDIDSFCGNVTPGEGRLASCVQAYEDQLSRRCRFALRRISSKLERAVQNITDACWNDIQAHCGEGEKIGQCAVEKSASFSPTCQTVVAALRQTAQAFASLRGMPVFASDDKNLGQVVEVARGPDGKIQSVQVQIGRFLGIGDKVVSIDAAQIEQLADRIKLRLNSDQVRSLPEAKKPS